MGLIGRWLWQILLTITVGWMLFKLFSSAAVVSFFSTLTFERFDNAQGYMSYQLDEKRWTAFALPNFHGVIRVMTQAEAFQRQVSNMDSYYALEYRILDTDGMEIDNGVYHHKLAIGQQSDDRRRYFRADSLLPISYAQSMYINMDTLIAGQRLEIRQADSNDGIAFVYARVYASQQDATSVSLNDWQRLSQGQQRQVAQGLIFGRATMSDEDKKMALARRWRPLGPQGIINENYVPQRLYFSTLDGDEPTAPSNIALLESLDDSDILIAKRKRATLPILASGEWTIQGKNGQSLSGISYRWYPIEGEARVGSFGSSKNTVLSLTDAPGLLELVSHQPRILQFSAPPGIDGPVYDPLLARSYCFGAEADDSLSLHFRLPQVPGVQPYRLDVRQLKITEDERSLKPLSSRLRVAFLDQHGDTLSDELLTLAEDVSLYDRVDDSSGIDNVEISERRSWYVTPKHGAARLQISSQDPVCITLYTRPDELVWARQWPEQRYPWLDPQQRMSAWFSVAPDEDRDWQRKGMSRILRLHYRPPELFEDSGSLQSWINLRSLTKPYKALLEPVDAQDYTPEQQSYWFSLLQPKERQAFVADTSLQQLMYLRSEGVSPAIDIHSTSSHRQQSLRLPGLAGTIDWPSAWQRSAWELPQSVTWFANYRPPGEINYRLRQVEPMGQGLAYQFKHRQGKAQTLAIRWYRPAVDAQQRPTQQQPMTLKLTIEAPMPPGQWLNHHSIKQRTWELKSVSAPFSNSYLLQSSQGALMPAEAFYVDIPEQAISGNYRVQVEGAPSSFASVGLLVDEQSRRVRVYKEFE
tara:strand:+ start:3179 stop:5608 length:2430 start_codon:yes stop_codon:yes gene_type:complete